MSKGQTFAVDLLNHCLATLKDMQSLSLSVANVSEYYNYRGSLHTSQISHLLLYPSLWLLVLGQFLPLFPTQTASNFSSGQQNL